MNLHLRNQNPVSYRLDERTMWYALVDLNHGLPEYETGALPTELRAHMVIPARIELSITRVKVWCPPFRRWDHGDLYRNRTCNLHLNRMSLCQLS